MKKPLTSSIIQQESMQIKPTKFVAVLIGAAVLTLAGCGGGGGGSPAATSSTTISGNAIKGPLTQAKINIYKTVNGAKGDLLQTVTSDANGSYTATITDYSGVVLVEAIATAETRMYDEATGQTVTPTLGFTMRASFVAQSGTTYSTQINPYTELATATALAATGGLSSANVEQSNSALAAALQFNPLTTAATFDADKKPTNAAAVALAAISEMALAGDQGCTTGDQAAKVTCITTALTTLGLGDTGIQTALQTNITAITTNLGLPTQTITDPAKADGSTPPVITPLEQAKAFISTLRSNAKALDAVDLSLQTELQKVSDDLSGRTAPIATSNVNALRIAMLGAQFWADVIQNPNATFVASKTFFKTNDYYQEPIGGCTFYADTNYDVVASTKAEAKAVGCASQSQYEDYIWAIDDNGEPKQCTAVGEWCGTKWSTRVRLTPDAVDAKKFTVYTQTREAKQTAKTFVYSYYDLQTNQYINNATVCPTNTDCYANAATFNEVRTHYGAPFPGNAATLTTQRDSNGRINAVNLAGELSPAYAVSYNFSSYYDEVLQRWVFKPNQTATVFGDKHNVALAGALTQVSNLEKLAISGSMALIKDGVLETRIELAEGSYLQATPDGSGGYSTTDGSQEMLLKLKGGSSASSFAGDLKISAFKLDKSNTSYIPTLMSFNGSVQRNDVSFFEGAITGEVLNYEDFNSGAALSEINAQTMRVGFVGSVIIPNRPVLKVSLSVTQKDTGSFDTDTSSLTGQYVQGYTTINLSGTGSATSKIVTLESTTGMKLVIDNSKSVYPLTNGGVAVGEFSPSTNTMTYTDNSYEQF